MASIPTVQIQTPNGPVTINASDFDSAVHTQYAAEKATDDPKPEAAKAKPRKK